MEGKGGQDPPAFNAAAQTENYFYLVFAIIILLAWISIYDKHCYLPFCIQLLRKGNLRSVHCTGRHNTTKHRRAETNKHATADCRHMVQVRERKRKESLVCCCFETVKEKVEMLFYVHHRKCIYLFIIEWAVRCHVDLHREGAPLFPRVN